ncbi:MAG: iron-sulfur cluster assembly accessory protein [Candidatus Anammoximicrobium sp.]|nr:iron-sulfur cluster assembly accessory protein [Candidatus Anammoximicrobium sp.]
MITLTERAAGEVKRVKDEQKLDDDLFLRIGVAGGGCSGFSYTLGFDANYDAKKDSKHSFHGVDVVVDKKSALYLDGTTVDWYDSMGRCGFTFDNPNALRTCSCSCGG